MTAKIWIDNTARGNGRELMVCHVDTITAKVDVVNMETSDFSVLDIRRFSDRHMVLKEEYRK